MRFKMLVGAIMALAVMFSVQSSTPTSADPQCPQPDSALCSLFQSPSPTQLARQRQLDVMYNYLDATIADLDQQWSGWFSRAKLSEPWVQYTIVRPGDVVASQCGKMPGALPVIVSDVNNVFYCRSDKFESSDGATHTGRIIMPLDTFTNMADGNILGTQIPFKSKFSAAVVVAHEFGHSVQAALSDQLHVSTASTMQNELLADCFAGNWAHSQDSAGQLLSGDLDAARAVMNAIGDTNVNDPDHHGTSQERVGAFSLGLSSSPVQCMRAYWPQMVPNLK